ncbi:MAG: hypothetical protein D6743_18975, partial [Calditrichaeota bacterium]
PLCSSTAGFRILFVCPELLVVEKPPNVAMDGPEDRLKLKQEILDKCNEYLKKGKLKRVYFSNFIMQ